MSNPIQKDIFDSDKDSESKVWWIKEELQFLEKSLTKMRIEYSHVFNRTVVLRDQIKTIGEEENGKKKTESE